MAASCDLNIAKKNVSEALGDNMKLYLQNLKSWFRQKISKEDFDLEARKMLKPDTVHLHNKFLLAILAKCQTLSSSIVPKESFSNSSSFPPSKQQSRVRLNKKASTNRNTFQQKFVAVNTLSYAPHVSPRSLEDDINIGFASREATLPDISMVHGRMFVCAWENGLDDVADNAVKFVMLAVEHHLKDIIVKLLSRRSGFRLREKRFIYAMGSEVPNPYLRQSYLRKDHSSESEATEISSTGMQMPRIRLSVEGGEQEAVQRLAAITPIPPTTFEKGQVTLFDLLDTLQLYKNSISAHSVYVPAVEKIIHKLWHPCNEDLEQENIYQQEMYLKQQLAAQHLQVK